MELRIVVEASGYEKAFSGNSLLTEEDKAISDVAGVTGAIIRNLLLRRKFSQFQSPTLVFVII